MLLFALMTRVARAVMVADVEVVVVVIAGTVVPSA